VSSSLMPVPGVIAAGQRPCCRYARFHAGRARRERFYPSDMTDAEWEVLEPLLPVPACATAQGGHPERYCRREIVDALRYLVDQGCKWRGLPRDFAPWKRVYAYFVRWEKAQVSEQIVDELRRRVRVAAGRDPEPSAAIIDSQSVRAAATVGRETRGWDNGKKVTGRKRHIAVDTLGLLICVFASPAHVQDRDAARVLLGLLHLICPKVRLVWADGGYAGQLVKTAKRYWSLTLQIVKRSDAAKGTFVLLPRRWVVERSFAHLANARRIVRDYERLEETHEAMVRWAAIRLMTRLATQHTT
jgi:transposase